MAEPKKKRGRTPGKTGSAASKKRAKPPPEVIEALRMSAMSVFTRARVPLTLDQMADMPAFRLVPKVMLRSWADEDNWSAARAYELSLLRQAIQRHASGELVRHKRRQLITIAEIQDQAMQILRDELCAPTSWNDTARVAFKAHVIAADITRGMVGDVADGATADDQKAFPQPAPGGLLPPAVNQAAENKVSDEEAAVGAHAILAWRRNKLLEQMAGASPGDVPPPIPPPISQPPEALPDGSDLPKEPSHD